MRKLTATTVQETSVTSGTGAVTLSQYTGWMRFSDRFIAGDTPYYSIRDGNNWEHGQGTVGIGQTLARTRVLETLVAGVVTVTPLGNGSPINLSGAGSIVRATIPEELFSTVSKLEPVLISVTNPATFADGYSYGILVTGCAMTLPVAPVVNDRMEIYQAAAGLTNCTLDPNGGKINNTVGVMTIDVPDFDFSLIYVSAAYGWKVRS